MKIITTTDGYQVKVDDWWYDSLSLITWSTCGRQGRRYAVHPGAHFCGKRKAINMHRVITSAPTGLDVDHINHDCLDNRESNLRVCTKFQNQMNRIITSRNRSGIKGVYFSSSKCQWCAQISAFGIQVYLGGFESKRLAIDARERAEKELHGEFALRVKAAELLEDINARHQIGLLL